MFNYRLKTVSIVLFLLISLTLTIGCSKIPGLSSKPSEEQMKSIILAIDIPSPYVCNVNYEKFQITNGFNRKINDENYYCVEANYKINFDVSYDKKTIEKDKSGSYEKTQDRFCFVKRGKDWYGNPGWVE